MKIRCITCFFDPSNLETSAALAELSAFSREAAERLAEIGIEVQTTRLATTPFSSWIAEKDWLERAVEFEAQALAAGFKYISLGPASPNRLEAYEIIPEILAASQNLFLTANLTSPQEGVSLPAVNACGRIIARSALITPDGFANLRFAALANVPPNAPFLPSAYHQNGDGKAVALGVECADLILRIFSEAKTFHTGRKQLIETIEGEAARMEAIIAPLCDRYNLAFKGFDFSTAPYPQDWCSLAGALEALGIEKIGWSGSLAAAAFLADTLDRGGWRRVGFNGLFLPVMEDSILALRAAEGSLTVRDLLLFSSVCGVGLDTVPLPGDSTPEQLSALLLDVAALSARLNKPLTARLMPIPGKAAGDQTEFDFEFFASSRVMHLPAAPLHGLLAGNESLDIRPRGR